jgi:hypothetical protein
MVVGETLSPKKKKKIQNRVAQSGKAPEFKLHSHQKKQKKFLLVVKYTSGNYSLYHKTYLVSLLTESKVKMKFIFDQVETLVPEAISQFH